MGDAISSLLSNGQDIEIEGDDIIIYPEGELVIYKNAPATFEGDRMLTRAKQVVVFRSRPDGWGSYQVLEEE